MTAFNYPPPLDRLLTYGDCRKIRKAPDYVKELGLTPDHIPDLIRMATDAELNWADSDGLEVWAPIHAWRSLGQLKAEAAIDPLLSMFLELEDSDWINEEMPQVFAQIGPVAIPALKNFLANSNHHFVARIAASSCLAKIALAHPEARTDCVTAITQQLAKFQKNAPDLNGFLVADLLKLKAVESAPVMERAFAARRVDPTIAGDWLDLQIDLGLKTRAEARQIRTTVDAENLGSIAALNSHPSPQGFGSTQANPKKKKKK